MSERPLAGLRVLSMEQAAALPFATRHLVDLGAEVIRVQAPSRAGAAPVEPSLFRGKRMLGLDLARPGGPETFLRLAKACDVVAHNFTPRVMRKYGIDFDSVRAVNPRVIYCALTGFGSTGPWAERPLFGPGAEAISGHNLLIGEAGSALPGRPGTVTYADYLCGTNLLLAVLDALHARRRGLAAAEAAMFVDISLYECAVAQLGGTLAGRQAGGVLPTRVGNADHRYAVHGVFNTAAPDRCVAIVCDVAQAARLRAALDLPAEDGTADDLARAIARWDADALVQALQAVGVPAMRVEHPSDIAHSRWLHERGHMARGVGEGALPVFGPLWGGGAGLEMAAAEPAGASNAAVFASVGGCTAEEIAALHASGAIGEAATRFGIVGDASGRELHFGLLARVDVHAGEVDRAGELDHTTTAPVWRCEAGNGDARNGDAGKVGEPAPNRAPRLLELPGGVGTAWAARLLAGLGWDVVKAEPAAGDPLRRQRSRWGDAEGASHAWLNAGKRSVLLEAGTLAGLAAAADVVLGDLRATALAPTGIHAEDLEPRHVRACLTPFGATSAPPPGAPAGSVPDLLLQAASGFLFLTGEHDGVPQQLPPDAAGMLAGTAMAAAIVAAQLGAMTDGERRLLDVSEVEPLLAFTHAAVSRYHATGEVVRREGRAGHALRMAPTTDGFVYCAPGAVQVIDMRAMATLLDDPELAAPRFATAPMRMQHWEEYVARLCARFATRPAAAWFEAAAGLHLTFSLVQTMDDLLRCPQLLSRGLLQPLPWKGGVLALPVLPFRTPTARAMLEPPPATASDTAEVLQAWLAPPSGPASGRTTDRDAPGPGRT